jgi:phosphatidylglycerophosphatase A
VNYEEIKDTKPQQMGELVDRSEDGENYVIKLEEDKVYEVAPIAYYVWSLCDGNSTVDEIINKISTEAELAQDQVRDPVVMVINELVNASLVSLTQS